MIEKREREMQNGARKTNILLVDDNPSNLLSLETILGAPDRNLVRASSGEEALRFLLDEEAAVILLDVRMPNIDGLETAALIRGRERTRNVPIIFLTAYDSGDNTYISQGYSLGAVDYIIKPINPEALKSKVAVFVELFRKTEQVKHQAAMLREKNLELEYANLQRLSRLIELGQQLVSERDPEKLLETFCHEARAILNARYGAVKLLDEGGHKFFFISGFKRDEEIYESIEQISMRFLENSSQMNRPLRLSISDRNAKSVRLLTENSLITSFLAAPLLRQGQTQGWLYLANKVDAKEFKEADERLAVTLTSQAAVSWENARLYAEAQRHTADLEQEIADRKQAEQERAELLVREQRARAEAETANRLKDEFLATVSHELRAPLNAMLGWVTLVRDSKLDGEDKAKALETIERNARAQKKLIDDLLDVSRIITGKLSLDIRPSDLVSVIELAVESARPAAEAKRVSLETEFDSTPCPFLVDPNRLQQVIWNLVSNAVKFTPVEGNIKIRLICADKHVEIIVIDSGIGIAPEFLPHVFDRFRQADGTITRKHGGLGLGLAIVRHLVEMHGGEVTAESAGAGRGSTFKITLPLMTPQPVSNMLGMPLLAYQGIVLSDSGPKLSGLRVLVVDDQSDARDLIAAILSLKEAEVKTAGGLTDAMKILKSWQPEILISDITMPDGDGYELINHLRHERDGVGAIPALAITANAGADDRIRAIAAGFHMHLPKPVEADELVVCVASLTGRLARTQEVNE